MSEAGRRVDIIFYAGYKGEETPRAVVVDGRVHPVEDVLSRTRGLRADTRTEFEIFRVRIAGRTIDIRRDASGETELLPSSDHALLS